MDDNVATVFRVVIRRFRDYRENLPVAANKI
jgi:hypothetical protein